MRQIKVDMPQRPGARPLKLKVQYGWFVCVVQSFCWCLRQLEKPYSVQYSCLRDCGDRICRIESRSTRVSNKGFLETGTL